MLVIALPLHFYPESIFFYTQILYRENTFVASVNFFGESLRFCGTFAIINTNSRQSEVSCMKKHPLLTAAAAAGTAVLGAAYGIYRVAFYQKPTTAVPSPADMPTREVYRKAMCPDADALARDTFTPVHITAQDGTPLGRTVLPPQRRCPAGYHLPRLPGLCRAGRPGRLHPLHQAGL